MTDLEAYRLEKRHPVKAIESRASGLKYLIDGEAKGVIISGQKGMTGLSLRQLKALRDEIPGILEEYF